MGIQRHRDELGTNYTFVVLGLALVVICVACMVAAQVLRDVGILQ